jgi:Peptidase M50B-like
VEILAEIWDRAVTVQPVPGQGTVILAAVAALVLVVAPRTWPLTRQIVTISHEGGHAFAALVTGRRLAGIRLHSDTSGLTVSHGKAAGPGMVIMLVAGYLAPAVAGVGAALLLAAGHAVGLLWLLVVWLAAMLVKIRNVYGFAVLLGCGALTVLASWYLPGPLLSTIAYLITWVLLIAAPRPVLELIRFRRRSRGRNSDVDQLARLTPIPAAVWIVTFLVLNLLGLGLGVVLLL